MNTEFATAFAVLWLATVFFMTSQSQRRREAARNFSIVMEEAERVQDAVDAEERDRAFSNYEPAQRAVEALVFPPPPVFVGGDDEVSDADLAHRESKTNANFSLIQIHAMTSAVAEKLTSKAKAEVSRDEANLLKRLIRPKLGRFPWDRRFDFGVFVENLLAEKRITAHPAEWRAVANAYDSGDPNLMQDSIDELADRLG